MESIDVNNEMKKSGSEHRKKIFKYFYELWLILPNDYSTVKYEIIVEEFIKKILFIKIRIRMRPYGKL